MDTTYEPSQVGTLTPDQVIRAEPTDSLATVAEVMGRHDIGAVVVGLEAVDGIITERDLVRAVARGQDPATVTAGEVMTTELSWCDARTSPEEAAQEMMERYLRHLLVEDDGALVGIVSARDLLGAISARTG